MRIALRVYGALPVGIGLLLVGTALTDPGILVAGYFVPKAGEPGLSYMGLRWIIRELVIGAALIYASYKTRQVVLVVLVTKLAFDLSDVLLMALSPPAWGSLPGAIVYSLFGATLLYMLRRAR